MPICALSKCLLNIVIISDSPLPLAVNSRNQPLCKRLTPRIAFKSPNSHLKPMPLFSHLDHEKWMLTIYPLIIFHTSITSPSVSPNTTNTRGNLRQPNSFPICLRMWEEINASSNRLISVRLSPQMKCRIFQRHLWRQESRTLGCLLQLVHTSTPYLNQRGKKNNFADQQLGPHFEVAVFKDYEARQKPHLHSSR